ncbi:UNVERIFIED_CONTAM: hypothetical protein K2H54_018708, partial [Gekko kuhli]
MVPSRSPSVYSRPPSELFDPEDVSPHSGRELHSWFADVESSKPSRHSQVRSRGARDGAEAHHLFCHYARLPSPETYARLYYASRELSDSRYPHFGFDRSETRRDRAALSPPLLPKQPPIQPRSTPSAALGAPPEVAPLESPDPPLYVPDLTREESSSDSTDHDSEDLDSNWDDSILTPADSDLGNAGSLSPSDGPKAFLQLMDRMCKALKIQFTSPASKETDYVHKLVQADMPAGVLLPMLPVHLSTLREAWDTPASIPRAPRHFNALYKLQPGEAKFLVSHPIANSLIVHSASKAKQAKHPIPPDREGQKLDTL